VKLWQYIIPLPLLYNPLLQTYSYYIYIYLAVIRFCGLLILLFWWQTSVFPLLLPLLGARFHSQMKSRPALVAYGTETGNAYDYAEELGRLLERVHFFTHVSKLDAVDTASRLVIDGEIPSADCVPTVFLKRVHSRDYCRFNYRPGRFTNKC